MEKWDIMDENGVCTGRTIRRDEKLIEGEYHLVVHIWIKDSNDRYLIQKRANNLKLYPGIWATTKGSVLSGESSIYGALRETREELGIEIEQDFYNFVSRVKRKDDFVDIWLVNTDIDINSLSLQREEVSEVKYASKEEIKQMIGQGVFYNYGDGYLELLFGK